MLHFELFSSWHLLRHQKKLFFFFFLFVHKLIEIHSEKLKTLFIIFLWSSSIHSTRGLKKKSYKIIYSSLILSLFALELFFYMITNFKLAEWIMSNFWWWFSSNETGISSRDYEEFIKFTFKIISSIRKWWWWELKLFKYYMCFMDWINLEHESDFFCFWRRLKSFLRYFLRNFCFFLF